jgi:hypothetical protein
MARADHDGRLRPGRDTGEAQGRGRWSRCCQRQGRKRAESCVSPRKNGVSRKSFILLRPRRDLNPCIIELTPLSSEEIRNARPLATVLPQDALTHAMLIAATVCADRKDDRAVS